MPATTTLLSLSQCDKLYYYCIQYPYVLGRLFFFPFSMSPSLKVICQAIDFHVKGQINPKSRLVRRGFFLKKTDEFDLFAVKSKKTNITNLSVPFLGESIARQSAFEINWPLEACSRKNKLMLHAWFKWAENAKTADYVKIKTTALFKAFRIVNLNYF